MKKDKFLHAGISIVLTVVLVYAMKDPIGGAVAFGIGIFKEVIDEIFKRLKISIWFIKGTGFSFYDLVAGLTGCIIGMLIVFAMALAGIESLGQLIKY